MVLFLLVIPHNKFINTYMKYDIFTIHRLLIVSLPSLTQNSGLLVGSGFLFLTPQTMSLVR